MTDVPLTAEPHFWIKEIGLPVVLALGTTLLTFYAKRIWAALHSGYRASAMRRIEAQLKLARRLHAEPHTAQLWMTFQAASSPISVAAFALASALLVMGFLKAPAVNTDLAIGTGAVMLGVATGQLATHFWDAIFVLRAALMFDRLEEKLQRRLDRLAK